MAEILNRLDFFRIGRRYIASRAQRIDPSQVDVEGSDINLYVGSSSYMSHAIARHLVDRVSALTLAGAEDEDLDRYVIDRYQEPRKGAAAALVTVRFYRSSASAGAGSVPIGQKLIALTGVEYITIETASFGAASLEISVTARAVLAGKEYQVGANQIRKIDRPELLFDPTIQVNNDAKAAGGEPAEEDSDYRVRIQNFWRSARRGTREAIEYGATTVPGVVSAQASEAVDNTGRPARLVNLYIADSSGVASAALGASVLVALDEYRACGIPVLISLSLPEIVDVRLSLTFTSAVDTVILTEAIRNAVVAFVNSLAVNQPLSRADLFSLLRRYANQGLIVTESSVIAPAGNVIPTVGRTLRTTLANVTVA